MVSWNIDGLDKKNLEKRTAHIIQVLKKIKPDVILLQEVTDQIVESLERHLVDYNIIEQAAGMDYFTCVLLRTTTIYLDQVPSIYHVSKNLRILTIFGPNSSI